jgi:hypothetical protein
MSSKIYTRYGFSDILVAGDQDIPKYIPVKDIDGFKITETEISLVGFEDENGNECEEDGTLL